jgi:tripartite-type tricarboxylate transporter receptor subunit TctC
MLKRLPRQNWEVILKGFAFLGTILLLFVFVAAGASASEKPYPNKPINMIIGFSPGGATDLGSKIIAEKMGEFLGQPLIPTYKPGGGGILSASYVAKAKPDGYTVLSILSFMNLPPEVKNLDYKLDDFILTGMWGRAPYYICVKADSKWKTFKDLVEAAKKEPGKYTFGTIGTTGGGYFIYELLVKYAGIKLTYVPFKSCADTMTAVMGGHLDLYFCPGAGYISEKAVVRTLANGEEKRLEAYPEIPTIMEFGYPVTFSTLYGFAFPKGTPKDVIDKFSTAQKRAIEKYSKELNESYNKIDMVPAFLDGPATVKEFNRQYEIIRSLSKEIAQAGK